MRYLHTLQKRHLISRNGYPAFREEEKTAQRAVTAGLGLPFSFLYYRLRLH